MQLTRAIRFGVKALTGSITAVTLSIVDHSQNAPLSGDEWRRIIDHLCSHGHRHFLFAGGDPLTHPDVHEILAHAHRSGAALLVTPGTQLELSRLPTVDTLAIAVVPGPGALPQVLAGLQQAGSKTTAEALVVTRPSTAPHLVRAVEQVADHGVSVYLSPDDPTDWGDERPFHKQGETSRLAAALQELKERRRELNLMVDPEFIDDLCHWWGGKPAPCYAGDGLLAIDPFGRPRPCRRARAVDIPVTSIAHQRRLREALIAARPSPCRCMYDDYWDHHLTRAHRLKGIARAARRTLRARRLRRR